MLRTIYRSVRVLLLATAFIGLIACGNAPAGVAPGGAPNSATRATSASPTVAGATTTAAAPTRAYAALPQSRTPEGYYVLGKPDAPVVMQHYSDFL